MDSQSPPTDRRRARTGPGGIQRLDRPRRVVLRDLIVYEIKLFLDGLKDVGISFLALAAVAFDMVRPGDKPGHRFYAVMRLGERLDRWLSLYGVAEAAQEDPEGMFGVSRAGSPTLLGRLEALVHDAVVGEEEQPAEDRPAEAASAGADSERAEKASSLGAEDEDLFSLGIAALDRAVDSLDHDRAPTREPGASSAPGSDAAPTDGSPGSDERAGAGLGEEGDGPTDGEPSNGPDRAEGGGAA